MKKGNGKAILLILILVVILISIIAVYLNTSKENEETNTNVTEVSVEKRSIIKTITGTGEIGSNLIENLELNTYRYFKEMCVSENTFVKKGENILKYTNGKYLVAPYDCVITKISVPDESGNICTSANYIEIKSTEKMYLTLKIEESEIDKIKVGQEVEVVANAYSGKIYVGKITKINQIGTYATSGTKFSAIIEFDNDGDLKIGMSANVTVTVEKAENVLTVPIEAVQTKGNVKYVVVVNSDGSTKDVTVETGLSNDAYVEIKSGLTGSEKVQIIEEVTTNTGNGNSKSLMQLNGSGMTKTESFEMREMPSGN